MKVLIIHCSYQFKGGEDTVVAEELKLLRDGGVVADLLAFHNGRNSLLSLLQMPFNTGSYIRTRRKLRAFQPDVVHIHNLHFAASASVIYAVKKSSVPFVVTLHNFRLICPSAMLFHQGKLFLNSIGRAFPVQAVLKGVYRQSRLLTLWTAISMKLHHSLGTWRSAARYIVLSKHAEQVFRNSGMFFKPGQLVIKPNFCSVPARKTAGRDNYFLYVGRLSEEKGLQVLLDAFAGSGIPLKIAGTGPLLNDVNNYCSKYPDIGYCGALNKEQVFNLLSHCTALVFPSTWYEGMPLTIIEAFACGTPVIASGIGAMQTMITPGYNGLHFETGNHKDLLKKIMQWQASGKQYAEACRVNARKTYEQYYTPEKNLELLLSIYEGAINSNPENSLLSTGQQAIPINYPSYD